MMLIVALAALVFAYAGSYYRLSRRGIREATMYGVSGFLYVPCLDPFERTDKDDDTESSSSPMFRAGERDALPSEGATVLVELTWTKKYRMLIVDAATPSPEGSPCLVDMH
jgi:hypothetical protein